MENYLTKQLRRKGKFSHNYNQELRDNIVKRMQTMLKTPEFIFCQQDEVRTDENDFLYFIAKGKCEVRVKDKFHDRYEEKVARVLQSGDHFGVSFIKDFDYYLLCLGNWYAIQMQPLSDRYLKELLHMCTD
jgi:hypothetical protein